MTMGFGNRVGRRAMIAGTLGVAAGVALPAMAAVRGGRAIVLKGARHVLGVAGPAGDILVRDGAIAAVGRIAVPPGADIVDVSHCIVMPGLVDTHWHMWNSMARGLASSAKGGFAPTMAAISPHVTPADAATGVRLALAEAVNAGITTVHNWAHNIRSPAQAEAEIAAMVVSGVRGRFAWGYPQDMAENRAIDFAPIANAARTAPSPLMAAVVRGALGILDAEPERRERLSALVTHAGAAFARLGLPVSGSPIQPIVLGDDARTMAVAAALRSVGFDVRGVRPPTVPAGSSRLRISLTLNVDAAAVDRLADALGELL